jgi:hypothetical protein
MDESDNDGTCAQKPMKDLPPKGDVKAGAGVGGFEPHHPEKNHTGGNGGKQAMQWTGMRQPQGVGFFRSTLFAVVLTQVITGVTALGVFLFTSGQTSNSIQARITELEKAVAANIAVAKRMDDQGTNFSHYNIANDKDKIADIYARIGVDELAISKINVMDEKITRIDTAVGKIQDNLSTKK